MLSKSGTTAKSAGIGGVRGGVRGELLSNGYKSLRAQGMLRVNKLDNSGEDMMTGKKSTNLGQRKRSKEMAEERVNICIEKTTTYTQDEERSKKKDKKGASVQSSPIRVNQNLVPKGLGPVKDR